MHAAEEMEGVWTETSVFQGEDFRFNPIFIYLSRCWVPKRSVLSNPIYCDNCHQFYFSYSFGHFGGRGPGKGTYLEYNVLAE